MDLFGWLRRRVAEAVVGGVSDGLARLNEAAAEADDGEADPPALARLRVTLALPEAPEPGPKRAAKRA